MVGIGERQELKLEFGGFERELKLALMGVGFNVELIRHDFKLCNRVIGDFCVGFDLFNLLGCTLEF